MSQCQDEGLGQDQEPQASRLSAGAGSVLTREHAQAIKVRPRIRRWAERVPSERVGYDAILIVIVTGPVLVTVSGMVSSGTVHPLLLQPMLC
jgi:hypothetical protein